jgi:hypothetical protein
VLLRDQVAVKVLPRQISDSPSTLRRFLREGRASRKFRHPNAVTVYDMRETRDGMVYLVLELVDGRTLAAEIRERGRLSPAEALAMLEPIANVLDAAHASGVVHRDLKPSNVMVGEAPDRTPLVKVLDLGIAKLHEVASATESATLTQTGMAIGTPHYMAPEQWGAVQRDGNLEVDGRADVYALGVVAYELVSGRPPFAGTMVGDLREAHLVVAPPPLHEVVEGVPAAFGLEVARAMAKDRSDRPQTAGAFVNALREALDMPGSRASTAVFGGNAIPAAPRPSPLIGREAHLEALQLALDAVAGGECRLAIVSGEAGVGKSRLVEAFAEWAAGRRFRVLRGRFSERGHAVDAFDAFAYQGFGEALHDYFRARRTDPLASSVDFADLAPELATLFPMLTELVEAQRHLDEGFERTPTTSSSRPGDKSAVFELLARALIRAGDGAPLVIIFEDLHLADASIETLEYVVRRLASTQTLFVGTCRDVDRRHPLARMIDTFRGDRRFTRVALEPFTRAELRACVEAVVGSPNLDESFLAEFHEATDGNPYFVRELLRSLVDSGSLRDDETGVIAPAGDAGLGSGSLPNTIRQTIEERIERLTPDQFGVLATASVLGRRFAFRDLELLAEDVDTLEDEVDRLVGAGFLEEESGGQGDRLAFSSGLLREVIHGKLPRRRPAAPAPRASPNLCRAAREAERGTREPRPPRSRPPLRAVW